MLTGTDGDKAVVLARLDAATIRVVLQDAPTWHDQVLALTLVDLLGRLFPRLDLPTAAAAAHPDLPPGKATIGERLVGAAGHGGLTAIAPGTPDLIIGIGLAGPADLHIDATGWQTYTGTAPSRFEGARVQCPVGPTAAACRAAAAAFGFLMDAVAPVPPYVHGYASMLTYKAGPDPLSEPDRPPPGSVDALLVGAGSVGGAAVYVLGHLLALDGRLVVVDPQRLDGRNPDRALLATQATADIASYKAKVARDALAHLGVAVDPQTVDITHWQAAQSRAPLPLVLCAVDSADARRAVQDCLPLRLVNAACAPREVTVSAHRTGDGPCVCCLHMNDVLDSGRARKTMIARETGLPEGTVNGLVLSRAPLQPIHLRHIERHRGEPEGSLDGYKDRTLLDLWNAHLLYGGAHVEASSGATGVVATAFTTALAGALLAGEALKHSHNSLASYRLGPAAHTQYVEDPYAGPANSQLRYRDRWPDSACLCRSARRARIASEIYGFPVHAT